MKKICSSVFIMLAVTVSAFANVRLPKIFGDNMVLQRNKQIPVWGWADAGEQVTIQFNKQEAKTVKADASGKWMLMLEPEKAGGPYTLTVKGNNTVTYNNVLVGEVWICSGQSNMEFQVKQAINSEAEIAGANYPQIRHIKVPLTVSTTPKDDIASADWKVCSPQTAGDFTAVGYFFARELYNQLHVPIGLINTTWGGTHSETWTSRQGFEQTDEFRTMIAGMPTLNLDSIAAAKKDAMNKKIISIQGSLPKPGEAEQWKGAGVDDSQWPTMALPALWEDKGLPNIDGTVWFRKEITITAGDAGKEATLELAMIDDEDVTYINGTKVGSTNGYNAKRKYTIPAGLLKAGKNTIAVRVHDTGGGGGIYGEAGDMKLTIGGNAQSLTGNWVYKVEEAYANAAIGPNTYPTLLYNAMLNPLIPYGMQGVIWYQGESNAGRAYQYRTAFPMMIKDWRQHWGEGDFPFYFVQLASFGAGNGNSAKGSTWAELREAQTMTLQLPNTGMAVTMDVGEEKDIHPKNKQDVGKRLAAIALNKVYGKKNMFSGPMYQSMKVDGNKIILSFLYTGGGLIAKGGELQGFEIAGSDQVFHAAKAVIEGNHVVVSADGVSNPVAVRFAWMDFAGSANLYNKEGFSASPFRTDDWKMATRDAKFEPGN